MDLHYFCTQLCDELDGAKDYMIKAIEIKPMNPEWSKKFEGMSETEKSHADNIYSMFTQYVEKLISSYNEVPKFITEKQEWMRKTYEDGVALYTMYYNAYSKL